MKPCIYNEQRDAWITFRFRMVKFMWQNCVVEGWVFWIFLSKLDRISNLSVLRIVAELEFALAKPSRKFLYYCE